MIRRIEFHLLSERRRRFARGHLHSITIVLMLPILGVHTVKYSKNNNKILIRPISMLYIRINDFKAKTILMCHYVHK